MQLKMTKSEVSSNNGIYTLIIYMLKDSEVNLYSIHH